MTIHKYGTVLAAAAAVFAGSAVVFAVQAETWKFALEEIDGSVQDAYAEKFKELVEDRTDGEISVQIYPYGTLGTSAPVDRIGRQRDVANSPTPHRGTWDPWCPK